MELNASITNISSTILLAPKNLSKKLSKSRKNAKIKGPLTELLTFIGRTTID